MSNLPDNQIVVVKEQDSHWLFKGAAIAGIAGFLLFLFSRRGKLGLNDGYKPVDGVSPVLHFVMHADKLFYIEGDPNSKGFAIDSIISTVKSQNAFLYWNNSGDVRHGDVIDASNAFKKAGIFTKETP